MGEQPIEDVAIGPSLSLALPPGCTSEALAAAEGAAGGAGEYLASTSPLNP